MSTVVSVRDVGLSLAKILGISAVLFYAYCNIIILAMLFSLRSIAYYISNSTYRVVSGFLGIFNVPFTEKMFVLIVNMLPVIALFMIVSALMIIGIKVGDSQGLIALAFIIPIAVKYVVPIALVGDLKSLDNVDLPFSLNARKMLPEQVFSWPTKNPEINASVILITTLIVIWLLLAIGYRSINHRMKKHGINLEWFNKTEKFLFEWISIGIVFIIIGIAVTLTIILSIVGIVLLLFGIGSIFVGHYASIFTIFMSFLTLPTKVEKTIETKKTVQKVVIGPVEPVAHVLATKPTEWLRVKTVITTEGKIMGRTKENEWVTFEPINGKYPDAGIDVLVFEYDVFIENNTKFYLAKDWRPAPEEDYET
jgi:hypothetical protein